MSIPAPPVTNSTIAWQRSGFVSSTGGRPGEMRVKLRSFAAFDSFLPASYITNILF